MKDADLIDKYRAKVLTQQRIVVRWDELNQILDLADVALRYRRLAASRQKKLDRARKDLKTFDAMVP